MLPRAPPVRLPGRLRPRCSLLASFVPKAAPDPAASEGIRTYTYQAAEGLRQKATIEHVWGDQGVPEQGDKEPWALGWQVNERNLGGMDGLKARLIKRVASEYLGISDEEMDWRLSQLLVVLPGLEERLSAAAPKLVARLAAHTSDVAERILFLKNLFPEANISKMVERRLTLLLDDDLEEIEQAEQKLRAFLPDIHVDKFVEAYPLVLDYDSFEMAAQDAMRILPGKSLPELLRTNPDIITSLVKGKSLLPYDGFDNPWS